MSESDGAGGAGGTHGGAPAPVTRRPCARQMLRSDLARYFAYLESPPRWRSKLRLMVSTEGIWALWFFRHGQCLEQGSSRVVRILVGAPFKLLHRFIQFLTGIHLSMPARVGPGLYIGHHGGIWVSPHATLGENCSLSQGVTIGVAGRAQKGPVLGDRVWVGPNATISGPVRIGSGAVIAANSLVVADIPENGVAVGVPARVISTSGSAHLLRLPARAPSDAD